MKNGTGLSQQKHALMRHLKKILCAIQNPGKKKYFLLRNIPPFTAKQ